MSNRWISDYFFTLKKKIQIPNYTVMFNINKVFKF